MMFVHLLSSDLVTPPSPSGCFTDKVGVQKVLLDALCQRVSGQRAESAGQVYLVSLL